MVYIIKAGPKKQKRSDKPFPAGDAGDSKENRFVFKRLNELEEKGRIIESRAQEIKLKIEKLAEQAIDANVIQENFASFSEVFEELKPAEKRELLQLLIKEILYDSDHGNIKIALRPLPDIGPLMLNHQNGKGFDVVSSWLLGRDSNPRLSG